MKEILRNSIIKELKLIKRLATKVPAGTEDYRPKENMRSIIELLQYLSGCGTGMLRFWNSNETEARPYLMKLREAAPKVTLENSAEIFDNEIARVNELFDTITEEEIATKEVMYPWGATDTLGIAIIETSIKWLTGYKMQLFLAIKVVSEEEISTPDLWRKTE